MTVHGMPGPGGSLGQCAVCGRSFVDAVLIGESVHRVEIVGIIGDVCVHQLCMPDLECARDEGWEKLPEGGPLRGIYAEAARNVSA